MVNTSFMIYYLGTRTSSNINMDNIWTISNVLSTRIDLIKVTINQMMIQIGVHKLSKSLLLDLGYRRDTANNNTNTANTEVNNSNNNNNKNNNDITDSSLNASRSTVDF